MAKKTSAHRNSSIPSYVEDLIVTVRATNELSNLSLKDLLAVGEYSHVEFENDILSKGVVDEIRHRFGNTSTSNLLIVATENAKLSSNTSSIFWIKAVLENEKHFGSSTVTEYRSNELCDLARAFSNSLTKEKIEALIEDVDLTSPNPMTVKFFNHLKREALCCENNESVYLLLKNNIMTVGETLDNVVGRLKFFMDAILFL